MTRMILARMRYGKNTEFKEWAEENPEAYQALIDHLRQSAIENAKRYTIRAENGRYEWVVTTPMPCPDCDEASLPKGVKLAYAKPGLLLGNWATKDDADLLPSDADSGNL